MSTSPPQRRMSSNSSSSKESLINAYEAEEERIINVLSRKLEKLREEKIDLENALEAESEATVNRLSREISALRLAQQQHAQSAASPTQVNGSGSVSPVDVRGPLFNPEPTPEMMLEAMRRENEQLRTRLVETERDYIRITRLNEIYREELIEDRRRLGLPVDNLIGLPSPSDAYSQPIHLQAQSNVSSISTSPRFPLSQSPTTHAASARVPIPRPPSQIRRPVAPPSPSTTPPSSSSASLSSAIFSPPGNTTSIGTTITTPGSGPALAFPNGGHPHELTYPSVPPPSLSSSFGDPLLAMEDERERTLPAPVPIPRPIPRRDRDLSLSVSPIDSFSARSGLPSSPLSPRRSFTRNRRGSFERAVGAAAATTNGRTGGGWVDGFEPYNVGRASRSGSRSRVGSLDRGVRVAETGQLVPRHRHEGGQGGTCELVLAGAEISASPPPTSSSPNGSGPSTAGTLQEPTTT